MNKFRVLCAASLLAFGGNAPAQEPAATPGDANPATAKAQLVNEREIVTQLQIFLDQQNFGPGIIDGRWGEFTGKALVHYARAHALTVTPDIYAQLPLESVYPVYAEYAITDEDAKWVGPVPGKPSEQAKVKRMPYSSLLEFIEERYHVSPDFLKKINAGKNLDALKAGDSVRVPNVAPFKIEEMKEKGSLPEHPEFAQRSVFVNTRDHMLDVYDGSALVAAFPITPGSKALPAPPGRWTIVGIATLPWFRWDEAMLQHGERSENFFNIPSGPNNPVGVLWTGLSKRGIGIHGTNNPETIGRAGSHGCIRLANWDAARFANMVTKNLVVTIY
ncbi:MAG: hypothetical protein QOD99_3093 [Chthoniobacter sp.]|nr:hypothetical protein [Chthoniobacter sp.]